MAARSASRDLLLPASLLAEVASFSRPVKSFSSPGHRLINTYGVLRTWLLQHERLYPYFLALIRLQLFDGFTNPVPVKDAQLSTSIPGRILHREVAVCDKPVRDSGRNP